MRITIHQPEHLPWLGFFHKAASAELLVILDVVQYRKNYFQNRNRILTANGPAWLTVPVLGSGHTSATLRDLRINTGDARWADRSWKTLLHAYGRHPYWSEVAPFLEQTYRGEWTHLVDLNLHIIRWFFERLGITTPLVPASELGVAGKSSELIRDICVKVGATRYLAGKLSAEYLEEELLEDAGIAVDHHHFEHPVYPQYRQREFVSHLSALDALCNLGPEAGALLRGPAPATVTTVA